MLELYTHPVEGADRVYRPSGGRGLRVVSDYLGRLSRREELANSVRRV